MVAIGAGETEAVGVSGVGVNICGRGVVVGRTSVGGDWVGGRKGVAGAAGAQAEVTEAKSNKNTDPHPANRCGSVFILPA